MTEIDSTVWAQAQQDYAASGLVPAWEELRFAQQMAFVQRAEKGQVAPAVSDVGIFYDVPAEDYHRKELGVASNSALTRIAKTPSHYRAWVDDVEPAEESDALTLGSALHCAVFEPSVYASDWVTAPTVDGRTKEGKAIKAEWQAANAGKREITLEKRATVEAMTASLRAHPIASLLIQGGKAEVTLRWLDPVTGLRCKARADYWREDLATAIDLKTTQDASNAEFARSCAKYRYHVQAAHYTEGFAALQKPIESFVFIAVEKAPPYAVSVKVFGEETIDFGKSKWRQAMRLLADCTHRDTWPGYPQEIEVIELPAWAMKESA